MQRPSDYKRATILAAATKLFASRPFHAVRLEDIAAEAQVGKGTLYVYFDSKEHLYLELVRDGFRQVVARLKEELARGPASSRTRIELVASGLVDFAFSFPDLYHVMRARILAPEDPELQAARAELTSLIESVLSEGVTRGELNDPHPSLTAQFMISAVRGALLYPPAGLTRPALREHLARVVWRGIGAGARA